MSTAAPLPAHERLASIDRARAERQTALIDALNNRLAPGLVLRASVATRTDAPVWIAFGDLSLAPLLVDGGVPVLTDPAGRPDAAAGAVALGGLEPVVAAIEVVIGRPLLPVSVVTAAPAGAVTLMVDAHADGRPLHRLLLAIDPAASIAPVADLPIDPASIADVAPAWTATIAAPPLRPDRLEAMAIGDLLLLGTGRPLARFTPPGQAAAIACRLHVEGGSMTVERAPDGAPQAAPGDSLSTAEALDARVPIRVEFDGGGLTMAQLAALAPGSVVPVPASGATLPVSLRAADRIAAAGELVAVGDGYGVLITGIAEAAGE